MHQGRTYHEFMLASPRDLRVRSRFQRLVCRFTPCHGTILDFGAGTGIDAKAYAKRKFRVLVHEPSKENRAYLDEYCRSELENGEIAAADLAANGVAQVIAADFAVLNLISDQRALFAMFSRLLAPKGHVVTNLLNPFFFGDARYAWWRANLSPLLRNGQYVVEGRNGPICRFTPAAVTRAAQQEFCRIVLRPAGLGLAFSQYMFMVFRKKR
jgi:SAM-dependent methyltransferase